MDSFWCYPIAADIKMNQAMSDSQSFRQFDDAFVSQIVPTELKAGQLVDARAAILDQQGSEIRG
jgi:hypothetical protein